MCKLCERDKGKMYPGNVTTHIADDRLAVLERDHELVGKLVAILLPYAGDNKTSEGAVECLKRIVKDHEAMERIRNDGIRLCSLSKFDGLYWEAFKDSTKLKGDPAEAILKVKEEDGKEK